MRALAMFTAALSLGCLWDYDTLQEESLGQADVAAILGGDLHKHSQAFYAAKAEYTATLIHTADKSPPHLDERYDDLAVAYAQIGKFPEALAAIAEKEVRFPNRYTTHANRGSILAMQGDLAGAMTELLAAIAINPAAHFGRERFQIDLLEYLAKKPALAATDNFLAIDAGAWAGDNRAIVGIDKPAKRRTAKDLDPAVAAIAGLVRFGTAADSPFVWEALGWALVRQGDASLAIRAFHRAEILGISRAREDGAVVASTIKANGMICCSRLDATPKLAALWTRISTQLDGEWAHGQSVDHARQAAEDALVAKHKYRDAFGY